MLQHHQQQQQQPTTTTTTTTNNQQQQQQQQQQQSVYKSRPPLPSYVTLSEAALRVYGVKMGNFSA
jgi:hypothetical protein